jgi:hypothetical protein
MTTAEDRRADGAKKYSKAGFPFREITATEIFKQIVRPTPAGPRRDQPGTPFYIRDPHATQKNMMEPVS